MRKAQGLSFFSEKKLKGALYGMRHCRMKSTAESGGEENRTQDQEPVADVRWSRSEEVHGVDSFSAED